MAQVEDVVIEQILNALQKLPLARSYDDLLLLKSYISKTEFITKDLAGVVNPRQMNDICRSLGLEEFNAGDYVFSQGDTGDKVFVILTGKAEVRIRYRIDLTQGESEIREKQVVIYHPGQYFGERALKFDEPRSASVICLEASKMITLHKSIYLEVLEEAKNEESNQPLKPEQLGTKEGIVKVLSKVREKRTPQELDGVASYLYRRIPFFQKFPMPHLIELCRVADSITIWGRSILFKQGQIGQAFYVILTGTVEVWVQDNHQMMASSNNSASTSTRQFRGNDLTEGLGAKVNHLITGDVFGERALENETSQRMASIITGEDNTELIVIAKEDYHNLVYVMMHADSMHKLQLLRRTELFHSLDIVHLRALSRFMEPKKFNIDEEIQVSGKKATELIIIEKGECRVVTEIQEGYEKLTAAQKYKLNHKRYMETSPRRDLITPRGGGKNELSPINAKKGGGKHPDKSTTVDKVAENHKLLHHKQLPDEQEELLQLSTKEIRKKSLLFAEKLKESLQVAQQLTSNSNSRPVSRQTEREDTPGDGARRNTNNRFRSMDMNLIGKRKKIDLGRIAPNSILAPYVLSTETPHQDVYHSETVIAASLVTTFAIGKHDFFNHMPKDSLEAIIKVIREYKPPLLNPLWENAPRVLDENQWKMEKVWERFRSQVSSDLHKEVNILDTMKVISRRHISVSSGNDPNQRLVSRLDDLLGGPEGNIGRKNKPVDLNWGLAQSSDDFQLGGVSKSKSVNAETHENHLVSRTPFSATPQTAVNPRLQPIQTNLSSDMDKGITLPPSPSAAMLKTVTNIIRNRINQANAKDEFEKVKPLGAEKTNASTGMYRPDLANSADTTAQKSILSNKTHQRYALEHSQAMDYPFALIHIHREVPHANPIQYLGDKRRLLKTYLRVNGTFQTCSKAKQMADNFMEQLYLNLFQSTKINREPELILHWNTFKGYESIDVHDTDLFFIYCRSVPVEFASIKPSKNIFNATYPSLCKPLNQRFAVLVVNDLVEKQTIQQASRTATPWDPANPRNRGDVNDMEFHNVYDARDDDDEDDPEKVKARNNRFSIHPRRNQNKANPLVSSNPMPSATSANTTGNASSTTQMPPNGNSAPATNAIAANGGTAGSSDRLRHLSSNDLIQLKSELSANGLSMPDFTSKRKPSMSSHALMPLYLKEISIVYEVIAVTPSRLESVKYAIHRFGTIERMDSIPILTQLLPNQTPAILGEGSDTSYGAKKRSKTPLRTSPSKTVYAKSAQHFQNYATQGQGSKLINPITRKPYSQDPNDNDFGTDAVMTRLESESQDGNEEEEEDEDDDEEENQVQNHHHHNNNGEGDHDIYEPSLASLSDNPFLTTKLYLKQYDINQPDRILKLIFHETNKKICILPLFKWILINEETMNTLNFLNIFDESSIKRIYLAEEFETIHQNHLTQTPGLNNQGLLLQTNDTMIGNIAISEPGIIMTDYSDIEQTLFDKNVDPSLIKSFSEAGLLPTKAPGTSEQVMKAMMKSQSLPEFVPSDKTKALEILQNEMLIRDFSTTFHQMKETVNSTLLEGKNRSESPSDRNDPQNEEIEENEGDGEGQGGGDNVEEEMLVSNSGGLMVDISELQAMSAFTMAASNGNKGKHNNKSKPKKLSQSSNYNTNYGGIQGNISSGSANNNHNKQPTTNKAMLIEQRLKALNTTASEQMKIVNLHEKLLLKESREMKIAENKAIAHLNHQNQQQQQQQQQNNDHADTHRSTISEITVGSDPGKANDKANKANRQPSGGLTAPAPFNPYQQLNSPQKNQLMSERLQVIEALQKITTPALNSTVSPVPTHNTGTSKTLKKPPKSSHSSNTAPYHVENTAAGRRLAESLRVLSDTLESQYKK